LMPTSTISVAAPIAAMGTAAPSIALTTDDTSTEPLPPPANAAGESMAARTAAVVARSLILCLYILTAPVSVEGFEELPDFANRERQSQKVRDRDPNGLRFLNRQHRQR